MICFPIEYLDCRLTANEALPVEAVAVKSVNFCAYEIVETNSKNEISRLIFFMELKFLFVII